MKKSNYFLLTCVIFFASCIETKEADKTSGDELRPFNQSYITLNNADDTQILRSQFWISQGLKFTATGNTGRKLIIDHQGRWISIDSVLNIVRTIPAKTKGIPVNIQRSLEGSVDYIKVKFDINNEIAFQVVFARTTAGEYEVYADDSYLLYNGEKYAVTANFTGYCKLLFIYKDNTVPVDDVKEAKGVDVGGNTTPNQNQPVKKENGNLSPLKKDF